MDRPQIGLRVDPELYWKLQEYMKVEKIDTVSGAVRRILAKALS